MIYVPKHTKNRHIHGDIRSRPGNRVVVLRKRREATVLKLLRYLFSKTVVSAFIIVAIVLATSKVPFLKADEVVFYPHACLGGFDSPKLSEGVPETNVDATKDDFDFENSASLDKSKSAELYCGNFDGDVTENTVPKQILLTIHMATKKIVDTKHIDGDNAKASAEALDGSAQKEVTVDGVKTENDTATSTSESDQPITPSNANSSSLEEKKVEAPQEKEQKEQVGAWLSRPILEYFLPHVFAEDVPVDTVPPAPTQEVPSTSSVPAESSPSPSESHSEIASDAKSTEVPPSEPSAQATLEAKTQNEDTAGASSSAIASQSNEQSLLGEIFGKKEESAPVLQSTSSANAQFEIKYSLGNNEWNSLAMLSYLDVKTLSLTLPYTPSAWSDLAQVQVMVRSLDNFDERESLFVDGMELHISYGSKDGVEKVEEREYYMGDVENISPEYYAGFSGIKGERKLLNLRAKEQVGVGIFSLESGAMIMSTSASDATSTIDPNGSLPEYGVFAVVFTKDTNWCNGKTLLECVSQDSAVGLSYFSLLSESKSKEAPAVAVQKKKLSLQLGKQNASSTEGLLDQSKEVKDTKETLDASSSVKKEQEEKKNESNE